MAFRNKRVLLRALIADPRHKQAVLSFDDDSSAVYATLTIFFVVGLEISVQIPLAKAFILEILQLSFEADKERGEKPDPLNGLRRRTGIGEIYCKRRFHAKPLAADTVTHYMIILQKRIRRGIEDALGISLKGMILPDFLFVRGDPWGVRIRPPGIIICRSDSGEAEMLA